MALPKPNYTQTPNELFDRHLPDMGFAELKVTLAIVRKTIGFHKQSEALSVTTLVKLTGLSRKGVVDGLEAAIKRGMVKKAGEGKRGTIRYTLNLIEQTEETTEDEPVKQGDWSSNLHSQDTTMQAGSTVTGQVSSTLQAHPKEKVKEKVGPKESKPTPTPVMDDTEGQAKQLITAWHTNSDHGSDLAVVIRHRDYLKTALKLLDMGATPSEVGECTKAQVPKPRNTAYLFNYLPEDLVGYRKQTQSKKAEQNKQDVIEQAEKRSVYTFAAMMAEAEGATDEPAA